MMTEILAHHIQNIANYASIWGFVFIFVFMTIESSFIPFPSEVVMIPAGILAYRCELTFGSPYLDMIVAIALGVAGSLLGAWINYYLAAHLGRPFLYKYGRYFFLKPAVLTRAESIFREYGDIATFVCRLLPAIRQLISIPAGLSQMKIGRFLFFTGFGATLWVTLLTVIGYYLGHLSGQKSYAQLVYDGQHFIFENLGYLFIGLVILITVYMVIHRKIMHTPSPSIPPSQS